MTNLTLPIFTDPEKARAHLERLLWPSGEPICPHCGVVGENTLIKSKSVRPGLYQCNACRKPFSVTVGTIMEKSHIPLNKWVLGFHLMASSKKGVSAHQLHRQLGITYKAAWFMAHRIREAMTESRSTPFGGNGGAVESDETFISRKRRKGDKPLYDQTKMKVLTLIDRDTKRARSTVVANVQKETIMPIIEANVSRKARMMTDQATHYRKAFDGFANHETVDHSKDEFVRGEAHTNTAEGFFSIFKRGMKGVYQHCGEQHLHRYLNEFDFRYSNRAALEIDDSVRAARAIKGAEGKRLTYHAVKG